MRWLRPYEGESRRRRGFLWIPRTCQGEFRWLEWAEWVERYESFWLGWVAERWKDE